MKIKSFFLFLTVGFLSSFGVSAQKTTAVHLPKIPYIETFNCSDNAERMMMYLTSEQDGKVVNAKFFKNNKFLSNHKLEAWNRFGLTFNGLDEEKSLFRGVVGKGNLDKGAELKPGASYEGEFYNYKTEYGQTESQLTVWQVTRTVGASKEISFNGTKVKVFPVEEKAQPAGELAPITISFLYAPSMGTALKVTSNGGGEEVSCTLTSYTKIK